jgi:hypothetical protein
MLEVTESLVSILSRSERAHKGGDGDDVGRTKEKDRALQEEAYKVEEDAAELACQRITAEEVAADTVVSAEVEQA